jgi:hypothetical protein
MRQAVVSRLQISNARPYGPVATVRLRAEQHDNLRGSRKAAPLHEWPIPGLMSLAGRTPPVQKTRRKS